MRWKRGNRLKLVSQTEAPPRTREIFGQICDTLGLPTVPVLYQAYAIFPKFLELHWEVFRPALESRQFFLLGARLAAESYTRAHNYFEIHAVPKPDSSADDPGALSIPQVLDYYQYLDPLLLLISTAQMQAFEGPVGDANRAPDTGTHPHFPIAPCLVSPGEATPAIQRIWNDRRRVLDLAFVSEEHRALACWPDFYREYWVSLKSLLQSPVYTDCQYRLGESAWTLVGELPVAIETGISQLLEAGLDAEELSSLARINEALMQSFTGLVLDITFARIAWEGGTRNGQTAPQKPAASESKSRRKRTPTRAA